MSSSTAKRLYTALTVTSPLPCSGRIPSVPTTDVRVHARIHHLQAMALVGVRPARKIDRKRGARLMGRQQVHTLLDFFPIGDGHQAFVAPALVAGHRPGDRIGIPH